jgi:hypothetical protein
MWNMVPGLLEKVGCCEGPMPSTSDFERQEWNLLMYAMVVNLPEKIGCEKGGKRRTFVEMDDF